MMSKQKVIPIAVGRGEPKASADGWRRLSTLAEPRLSEMAQNYRALGYEVEIREVQKSEESGCTTCFDAGESMGRVYGTLYIRRAANMSGDDDLFD